MRVALIGAGRIGRLHGENLVREFPDVELAWVVDVVEEVAARVAQELGVARWATDYTQALADPTVQAVLVCTSTDTHAEIVQAAARAGKHVFCEKPLALDLKEIDETLAAVAQAGVILQVGFHRRFDPHVRRLKELLEQGAVGTPWLLKITSYDPAPPPLAYVRVSGGIFLDMTIHDFDMARYLLGEVTEVYACGAALVDPEIGRAGDADTAAVLLRFQTGALGVITNCRKAVYGHDQRIEVLGEKGAVFLDNPRPHMVVEASAQGYYRPPLHYFFTERYREAYVAELRAFFDTVREGRAPLVTGWDGKAAVVLGHAARRSWEDKRPVQIREIDPHWA